MSSGSKKKKGLKSVLALDPSFRNTGWAVVVPATGKVIAHGVVHTTKSAVKSGVRKADSTMEEIRGMFAGLVDIVDTYSPFSLVAELPTSGGKSARAVASMAIAQAVCASLVETTGLPAEWVTPRASKKNLSGRADASKETMMRLIADKWPEVATEYSSARSASGFSGEFEHVADALAAYEEAARTSPIIGFMKKEA